MASCFLCGSFGRHAPEAAPAIRSSRREQSHSSFASGRDRGSWGELRVRRGAALFVARGWPESRKKKNTRLCRRKWPTRRGERAQLSELAPERRTVCAYTFTRAAGGVGRGGSAAGEARRALLGFTRASGGGGGAPNKLPAKESDYNCRVVCTGWPARQVRGGEKARRGALRKGLAALQNGGGSGGRALSRRLPVLTS